jgi:hypothetical protein
LAVFQGEISMVRPIAWVAAVALAGCALPDANDLTQKGTMVPFAVRGTPSQIAECVTDSLDRRTLWYQIERSRTLTNGSVELLGTHWNYTGALLWKALLIADRPGVTRVELTTRNGLIFLSGDEIRADVRPEFEHCAG